MQVAGRDTRVQEGMFIGLFGAMLKDMLHTIFL